MFNARVLALSVLTDEDGVDIIIRGLVSLDGHAWPDVGIEVECPPERQVQRDVALANFGQNEIQYGLDRMRVFLW